MLRISLVILAVSLGGCAAQRAGEPASHAGMTHPAATRQAVNLAALSLDQILPAPRLPAAAPAAKGLFGHGVSQVLSGFPVLLCKSKERRMKAGVAGPDTTDNRSFEWQIRNSRAKRRRFR